MLFLSIYKKKFDFSKKFQEQKNNSIETFFLFWKRRKKNFVKEFLKQNSQTEISYF